MKKKLFILLLAGAVLAAAGCGKKDTAGNDSSAKTEAKSLKIVYSDDSLDLAEYKNLTAEKNIYTVTQDAVDESIQSTLTEYAEYQTVERASQSGDHITVKFSGSADGETLIDYTDESYEIVLGDGEYGPDFDKKLTGAKAGDTLDFSISYTDENIGEDSGLDDLIGKTVKYHVEITDVSEEILPEYTDAFVKENLDAENKAAYEKQVKASLQKEYSEASDSELREALLTQVIENSKIKEYPDEQYQSYYTSVQDQYQELADSFGATLEDFGLTEEDLKSEALDTMYRDMIIAAIAEKENLSLSDEEFSEGAANLADVYEYESADELIEDNGEDVIRQLLLEEKVLDLLVDNATVTETPAEYTED